MRKLVKKNGNRTLSVMATADRCPVATKAVTQVKRNLRKQFLGSFADLRLLDLTLTEAESMAWETTVPHLFFPALAEEKLAKAIAWEARQRALKVATSELCFAA